MHVKLVVSGYAARLFVDGAANPQLTVTSLRRPWTRGMIGLWSFLGGANFSNVIVSPADTTAPAARPAEPPPAPHTLTTWELSPAFETTLVKDDVLPDRAALNAFAWTSVTADELRARQHRRVPPQDSLVRLEPGSRVRAFGHHGPAGAADEARVRLQ